jgi:carboxymethylenebutenolidase
MSMGEYTTIMARDGHQFQTWLSAAPGRPRGAVVVIQEIFGVNAHVRALTDDFAAQGYTAIAPCLFDRVRRGIELAYTPEDSQEGSGYLKQLKPENTLRDLAAAVAVVRSSGRVATVGYCFGGTMSYVAACQLPVACAVVYYGRLASYLDQKPKCPVMYHFGTADTSIPMSDVDKVSAAGDARALLYLYDGAGHGFNCDQRASYSAAAAALARTRTLDFLARYLGGVAT